MQLSITINDFERLETWTEIDQSYITNESSPQIFIEFVLRTEIKPFGSIVLVIWFSFHSIPLERITLRVWHRLHTKEHDCWNSKMAPKDCWHLFREDSSQGPRSKRRWPSNSVGDFPYQHIFWAGFSSNEILWRGVKRKTSIKRVSTNCYHYLV